jgi:hypothetical protein
LKAVK